jgi:peroxiredoxin
MKKHLFLTVGLILTFAISEAQTTTVKSITLNEHTVVKDSTGKVVPYETWHTAMQSGNYIIKSRYTKKDTSHMLHYISGVEKERIKKEIASIKAANAGPETAQLTTPATDQAPVTAVPPSIPQAPYIPNHLPRQSESFRNGEAFKTFKDKDINGEKIDINALKGKIVVLNFWFINCPACRVEMPELNTVVADYANDPNVVFVGLCLDQKEKIKDFLQVTPFNFKQIADARYYGEKYSVNLYPTTVVLDKRGVIRFNSVGADNTGYWIKKTITDINSTN